MKRRKAIKVLIRIVFSIVLIVSLILFFLDSWVKKKILAAVNGENSKYELNIDKVHVSLFSSSLQLDSITIRTKPELRQSGDFNTDVASIKCSGISLTKLLFKHDIAINEVTVSSMVGVIPISEDSAKPGASTFNLSINKILFERINLTMKGTSSPKAYAVKEGFLSIYHLQVFKEDTIFPGMIKQFNFKSDELLSVTPDSMYTISASGINYSSNTLAVNTFSIHPNYKEYDFTSRHKFQSDCIEADIGNISVHDFPAEQYLKSGSLLSSYVEIGRMEVKAFRDMRKPSSHDIPPMFQELIYNYPGLINIDSIGILTGKVNYTEHANKANHPGRISFNEANAKIYNIVNDTTFKTKKESLVFNVHALVMGKSNLSVVIKSPLFDRNNTFSVNGTLSAMEAKELNPIVERNAFIYLSSGRIDGMNFNFTANNTKSTGNMTLLYHDLDIAIENKDTDDTTALKEVIVSWIANMKIAHANPLPRKEVRVGRIAYDRDPQRFIFNYCFKAILSGIKSSIDKNAPKKKK